MKFLIFTVGKTHSGKTTFARRLQKLLPNTIHIDQDDIALFLKEKYPKLRDLPHSGELKFKINKLLCITALQENFNVVLSSGSINKATRKVITGIAKKESTKSVLVSFAISDDLLLKRISKSEKTTKVLNESKGFVELLTKKQAKLFESPNSREADYFFEIKKVKDADLVIKKLLALYQSSKNG